MTSPKNSIFAAATVLALAPAAALIFLAPTASAQTRGQTASVAVQIVDGAGASPVVVERIKAGARDVCAAVATHSPLLPREQADCVRETVAEAMRKLATGGDILIASK